MKAREVGVIVTRSEAHALHNGSLSHLRRRIALPTLHRSRTRGYAWTFRGIATATTIAGHRRCPGGCWQDLRHEAFLRLCPLGAAGDILWARETWQSLTTPADRDPAEVVYAADDVHLEGDPVAWRPSSNMPRWAARSVRRVIGVEVAELADGGFEWVVELGPATPAEIGPHTGENC